VALARAEGIAYPLTWDLLRIDGREVTRRRLLDTFSECLKHVQSQSAGRNVG
jgi:hypothetical protein